MVHSLVMASPSWAPALLPLVLVGIIGLLWYAKRLFVTISLLAHPVHRAYMLPSFSTTRSAMRITLISTALCAIALALLRLQYTAPNAEQQFEYGRDVVIAVDISRSMLVEDCNGLSRLACARKKIIELVSTLASDRVALIVFSGAALTLCPLTKDGAAFRMFLDSLEPDMLQGAATTSLSSALRTACTLLKQNSKRKNKLLVLFTDGEDFSSDFGEARNEAEAVGMQVSVFGVGSTEGGPVPVYTTQGVREGYQRDQQGAIVISKLNEPLLHSLTKSCGGLYASLDVTARRDIAHVAAWIQAREREKGETYVQETRNDLFMFCSGWALCALAIAWLL